MQTQVLHITAKLTSYDMHKWQKPWYAGYINELPFSGLI